MRFAIVLHKDEGNSYGVTVPDLPGCFSGADTLDDAFVAAQEAVLLHLEGMSGGRGAASQVRSRFRCTSPMRTTGTASGVS